MTTTKPTYELAKNLEHQLITLLNQYQPFMFYDTHNNTYLPITPYYPSLYKYSQFDVYNQFITLELKSRQYPLDHYVNNLLDTSKILNNTSIFLYTYNNPTNVLTDLHYIQYEKNIFDTFYIQHTKNECKLFIIPKIYETFTRVIPNIHSHVININYTDEYIDKHNDLISTDITKYRSTFGYHAILG